MPTVVIILFVFCLQLCVFYKATAQDGVTVRLVGGSSQYEGTVEVLFDGRWHMIQSNVWGRTEAQVVCRHLFGSIYLNAHGSFGNPPTTFGYRQSTAYVNGLQCTGSEQNLGSCYAGTRVNSACSSSCAAVQCIVSTVDVHVFLRGGATSYEGRLEILYNGYWGTVCQSSGLLSPNTLTVICRNIGAKFDVAIQREAVYYGSPDTTSLAIINDVECKGDESDIQECNHRGWITPNNLIKQCVPPVVACLPASGSVQLLQLGFDVDQSYGYVQFNYNGSWVDVLTGAEAYWTTSEASVVCQGLSRGSFGVPSTTLSRPTLASGAKAFRKLQFRCFGHGPSVTDAQTIPWNNSPTQLSQCHIMELPQYWDNNGYKVFARCFADSDKIRLKSSGANGTVQILYNNKWYDVSTTDQSWNDNAAQTLCNQLYGNRTHIGYASTVSASTTGFVAFQFSCSGSESRLSDCIVRDVTPTAVSSTALLIYAECVSRQGAVVSLVGGDSENNGRLQVQIAGVQGFVCDDGTNIATGNKLGDVVCKQLNKKFDYSYVSTDATAGLGNDSYILNSIRCNGNEPSIGYCSFVLRGFTCDPTRNYVVTVACLQKEDVNFRISNVSIPSNGYVVFEISIYNEWSFIKADDWGHADALVACRQLQQPNLIRAEATYIAITDKSNFSVAMDYVSCSGSETNLMSCSYTAHTSVLQTFTKVAAAYCILKENVTILSTSVPGYVQLQHGGQRGTISANGVVNYATLAVVICRQLGLRPGIAVQSQWYYRPSNPIVQYFNCDGSESNIGQCIRSRWYSSAETDSWNSPLVSVTCANTRDFEARLVGGTSTSGHVVLFSGSDSYICGDANWNNINAQVICRQLKIRFHKAIATNLTVYSDVSQSIPFLMAQVTCQGNEANIGACLYTSIGAPGCTQQNIAGVQCLTYDASWSGWSDWAASSRSGNSNHRSRTCFKSIPVNDTISCDGNSGDNKDCYAVDWKIALIVVAVVLGLLCALTISLLVYLYWNHVRNRGGHTRSGAHQPVLLPSSASTDLTVKYENSASQVRPLPGVPRGPTPPEEGGEYGELTPTYELTEGKSYSTLSR